MAIKYTWEGITVEAGKHVWMVDQPLITLDLLNEYAL